MIAAAAADLVIFTTDGTGRITAWTAGAETSLGWPGAEAMGRDVRFIAIEEDRGGSAVEREIARAFAKRSWPLSRWHVRRNGARIFLEGMVSPFGDTGSELLWVARDATKERVAQDEQKRRASELQHRIRNILANARSIIQRSGRTSDTVEEMSMHLEGRIDSIARTQLMLAQTSGAGLELEDIIREEMLVHAIPEDRLGIEGPSVLLAARAAEIVMSVIHELAINSVKYGAVQSDKGRIAVSWAVEDRAGEPWLRLGWTESGVRVAAVAPRREGFGAELILRRVPYELSGTGGFELRPGGIHASIEFPLRPGDSFLIQPGQSQPTPDS